MKYYCLLIQFIIWKQSCQTRRCFSYLLPHFSLCRSRTQKLADSQIACQCAFCYFIFIKITVQRQKKCTTILSEYIDSLASTEGENVLIYLVLLSLEDTPPKQNLKWRINVYSLLKFSQNCQKSFWNNEGFFFVFSLHAFDFWNWWWEFQHKVITLKNSLVELKNPLSFMLIFFIMNTESC